MSSFYSSALMVLVLRTRSGPGHAQGSWGVLDPDRRLSGKAVQASQTLIWEALCLAPGNTGLS